MHQLKFALGKEDNEEKSISKTGYSIKNYNKSKSQSMWALDPDITCERDAHDQQDKKLNKLQELLQSLLRNALIKERIFSQIIFYQIVQNIQVFLGQDISQINCLLEIQKRMNQILDKSKQDNKNFNVAFYELLVKRIKKIKKKQKKQQLNQYDRIIHNNFKKKGSVQYINQDANNRQEYLETKDSKLANNMKKQGLYNSKDGSSSKKSNSSNQGKLKGLLSQDKFSISRGQEKDGQGRRNDSVLETNQSVSFSSVISQSMAVRQRSPRVVMNTKKEKSKGQFINQEKQDDKEEGKDEAFIFFRPKKGKKVGY